MKSNNVILNFTMKFSTKIFSQKKNVLFAIEDADGKFALQISIETGKVSSVICYYLLSLFVIVICLLLFFAWKRS